MQFGRHAERWPVFTQPDRFRLRRSERSDASIAPAQVKITARRCQAWLWHSRTGSPACPIVVFACAGEQDRHVCVGTRGRLLGERIEFCGETRRPGLAHGTAMNPLSQDSGSRDAPIRCAGTGCGSYRAPRPCAHAHIDGTGRAYSGADSRARVTFPRRARMGFPVRCATVVRTAGAAHRSR